MPPSGPIFERHWRLAAVPAGSITNGVGSTNRHPRTIAI
jgi:hypothetical protein